mmetsp:Transcript_60193/g.167959  ORF Transcript_60193/g.167959 Transcript_60193/m.167959 type:complete len:306 (-) Transcript_60193:203-1120(-)|eukprot:CAMPEP_0117586694 /NCGR_PEP_ID=MMETSP0784-20121206/68863_1 /TAXON_ID=39447 /ORGANISM="" /LENGTH=305 /DNA_ID=CAMNT_0005387821 /DNA_START=101 /DNA_END=1018 /DNA_ORIENTATION=-
MSSQAYYEGIAHMVISTTCFACMAALSKLVGLQATTFEKIFWRQVAVVGFTLLGWFCGGRRHGACTEGRPRRPWLMVLRGLCGHFALSAYIESIDRLPLAKAVFLGKVHPIATAILARIFLGEPLGPARVFAILASLVGVALISEPAKDGFSANLVGVALGVFAGALSGAAYVCVRALNRAGESEFWVLMAFPLVSLPFCARDAWLGVAERGIDRGLAAQFFAVGLAAQGGQVFLVRGLAQLPASVGTQVMNFGSVIGALLGTMLGDPWPNWRVWTGGAIICASIQISAAYGGGSVAGKSAEHRA